MIKSIFNPFDKELNLIEEKDLNKLCSVNEGWYIEYKKQMIQSNKIAKSIAAFSNSYGGLLFFGVEADKKTNKAISFPGVTELPDKIHDSIRDNINPFPYFETIIIELNNGNHIIMIIIPEGDNTPYIHNDGKIYKRQESSSDPIPENNRNLLFELYKKSDKIIKKKEQFRTLNYGFCKGEDDTPFLSLFINTEPFNRFHIKDYHNAAFLLDLKEHFNEEFNLKSEEYDFGINGKGDFDSVSRYYDNILLKYTTNIDYAYHSLSVEIYENGNMKALIPIEYTSSDHMNSIPGFINFTNSNKLEKLNVIKFVGIENVIKSIWIVLYKYFTFLIKNNFSDSIEIKMKYFNCYRTSLYSMSTKYIDYIEEFGLPFCVKNEQVYPEMTKPIKFKTINDNLFMNIIYVISLIVSGFGISQEDVFMFPDWGKEEYPSV